MQTEIRQLLARATMAALAASLCACASTSTATRTDVEKTSLLYSEGQLRAMGAAPERPVAQVVAQGAGAGRVRAIVYFDFDRYEVKPRYRGDLEKEAQMLRDDPSAHVVIEGHTDQYGSVEYNLALGQRRADNVRRVLTLLGAREAQIETVSFGETKLAAPGDDERSRALNRRAELRDQFQP